LTAFDPNPDFARRKRATQPDDIERMLGVSSRIVECDWLKARLFLLRAMETVDARAKSPTVFFLSAPWRASPRRFSFTRPS